MIKRTMGMMALLTLTAAVAQASASATEVLGALIPQGQNELVLSGVTPDNEFCKIGLTRFFSDGISVYVDVPDETSGVRFGTLQIGLGHEIKIFEVRKNKIYAMTEHEAEEQYSSDSRSKLSLTVDGNKVLAASLSVSYKRILGLGWRERTNETCNVR